VNEFYVSIESFHTSFFRLNTVFLGGVMLQVVINKNICNQLDNSTGYMSSSILKTLPVSQIIPIVATSLNTNYVNVNGFISKYDYESNGENWMKITNIDQTENLTVSVVYANTKQLIDPGFPPDDIAITLKFKFIT
jgi:hypothetical protein